jgi:hypothetical protein
MTTVYVILGFLVLAGIGAWMLFKKGEKTGETKVVAKSQEAALDAVEKAHDVEEAADSGGDPEWQERVRKIGRRPKP